MTRRWLLAICMVVSLAAVVSAQPRGRGGFGMYGGRGGLLIDREAIRKELKVSDQQAELLDALQADLAEQRRVLRQENEWPQSADENIRQIQFEQQLEKLAAFDRGSEALVAVVLEPGQAARLSEIYLQRDGIRALERPEVASKLNLSDEQKNRLRALRETFVENRPSSPDQWLEQRKKQREREQEALRELLNDQQRAVWQQLLGKPFDFSVTQRRGFRTR